MTECVCVCVCERERQREGGGGGEGRCRKGRGGRTEGRERVLRTGSLHDSGHRLLGLVVETSALRAANPVFDSRLRWDFSGSSHTCDLKSGTPVAALPNAWHRRVSARTGLPGVSIL